MNATRIRSRFAVLGLLVLALGLSACGRKGPLDEPPGAQVAGAQPAAQPVGPGAVFGAPAPVDEAAPAATKGPKRRIVLDGLLN